MLDAPIEIIIFLCILLFTLNSICAVVLIKGLIALEFKNNRYINNNVVKILLLVPLVSILIGFLVAVMGFIFMFFSVIKYFLR
jgi:hypothetical protein